jgi:hypothetical protein
VMFADLAEGTVAASPGHRSVCSPCGPVRMIGDE